MADVQSGADRSRRSGHGRKGSSRSTRVDLTPMVDLGFLLITFFVFTTSMAKPNAMEVNMPFPGDPTAIPESQSITLIPTANHRIAYFEGLLDTTQGLASCGFTGAENVRNVVRDKEKKIRSEKGLSASAASPLIVVIKPADDCKYEDVVNLLDEMHILDVPRYAMAGVTAQEAAVLKKK